MTRSDCCLNSVAPSVQSPRSRRARAGSPWRAARAVVLRPCVWLLLAVCPLLVVSWATAAELPNIVLLMGDDHGWEETGYNGHPHVKTPVLDEIAATGLRFDRFYAGHPSCSPTRGSFLTGRHPNRYGTFAPGWSLRPQEITLAHVLSHAGYHCGHFGKWHVGPVKAESPTSPGAMGFHAWVSHDNFFELNPSLSRNGGPPEVLTGESSDVVVREAIRFIDQTRRLGKPFFTIVWFGSPHEPYSGLPADLAQYDDLPARYPDKRVRLTSNETGGQVTRPQGEVLRERYAEITAMDRAIGTLRQHLRAEGIRENTLLFYCGDNGTSADSALGFPHRGVKGQVYEGGVLVPGLIEWPARIPSPRRTTVRATTSDLLPTLCALTGQPLPARPLDGIDLTPVLDQATAVRTAPLFFWSYNTGRLGQAKSKPWIAPELQQGTTPLAKLQGGKATRDFQNYHHPAITDADYLGPRAIVDGDWKLVIHEQRTGGPRRELFDLAADPAEKSNLVARQPDVAQRLEARMHAWQQSVLHSLSGADYAP
ncbi:MAG: sulfatase [Pirellulaceae bacterium]